MFRAALKLLFGCSEISKKKWRSIAETGILLFTPQVGPMRRFRIEEASGNCAEPTPRLSPLKHMHLS